MGDQRYQVTLLTGPSVLQAPGDGFLWVVPASRVAMNTSMLIAFGPPLTFKVTRPSFFGGVPSYFEALWYPHLYFYRKSNT